MKKRSEQKGIQITNKAATPIQVYADERMLNSILLNLLSNAVKFTYRYGEITVGTEETASHMVEISVRDTGMGMQKNDVFRLFKIGEKVRSIGTEGELSTGLGLLLCQEFVEKQGGSIWAESEEGKGSTFYFTLPMPK
jgi:signal transduction histidine kinase